MDSIEIIEKIRTEIKIRLSANGAFDEEGDSAWHYDQGLIDAYNHILSFLSDLEKEEKPFKEPIDGVLYAAACGIKNKGQIEKSEKPNEGLEEEIEMYFEDWDSNPNGAFFDKEGYKIGIIALKNIARHFYELGRQSKPKVCEGLDEEIKSFLDKTGAPYHWCDDKEQMDWVGIIARHFYELGKQNKPVLSDDLEKAAREYAMDDFYNGYSSGSIIEDTMKNFKAGAKWGRRNLLQEIADGKTHPVDGITAAWLDNTEE